MSTSILDSNERKRKARGDLSKEEEAMNGDGKLAKTETDDEKSTKDLLLKIMSEVVATREELQAELQAVKQALSAGGGQVVASAVSAVASPSTAAETMAAATLNGAEECAPNGDDEDDDDDDESVQDPNDQWGIMFQQLREYRIIHGNCQVSKKGIPKLWKFADNQRTAYANMKLGRPGRKISDEKIRKLEGLGIHWGKKFPDPVSFEESLEEYKKYKTAMRCDPPVNLTNPSPLAKWVDVQRKEYRRFKKGRDSLLTMDQISQLNDVGFNWKGPRLP